MADPDWVEITRRNARSIQTTIGWIFWDPGAVDRYTALGVPGPLGYLASRCAPLAPAGPEAVAAAFGSISPAAIRWAFDTVASAGTTFEAVWAARDEAVFAGLAEHAPAILGPLAELAPALWDVVDHLPTVGRTFFASHLRMPRPTDPLLSGWHAVNCVREWRGDTHWAIVAAHGLTGIEASILHNTWVDYEDGWLPRSRGTNDDDLAAGLRSLEAKGLAVDGRPTAGARDLRQRIEDETDERTTLVWELLGIEASLRFPVEFEPACELLLHRVDITAGPNYQPGSRIR